MEDYFPTTQNASIVASVAHGKYDDMRMCWTGRPETPRAFAITDATAVRIAEVCEERVWLYIRNVGPDTVWFNFGGDNAPAANTCFYLLVNEGFVFDRNTPWRQTINAICAAGGTATLVVNDVWQVDVRGGRGA